MKRDLTIGLVAGVVAVGVIGWRAPGPRVPTGIYQASLDGPAYREMMQALAPPKVSTREARRKLESRIERFHLESARVEGVFAYLADAAGIDIDVHWAVMSFGRDHPITLLMEDVTVGQALRATVEAAGAAGDEIAYEIEPNRVFVTTQAMASREAVTRVYDVRDIVGKLVEPDRAFDTRRVPPAPLPMRRSEGLFAGGATAPAFADFATSPEDALDVLVRFLQEMVDPTSWRDAGGSIGSMRAFDYKLIVTNSRADQDHVAALIEWMREVLK